MNDTLQVAVMSKSAKRILSLVQDSDTGDVLVLVDEFRLELPLRTNERLAMVMDNMRELYRLLVEGVDE